MLADREGVSAKRRALLRGGFAGVYPASASSALPLAGSNV